MGFIIVARINDDVPFGVAFTAARAEGADEFIWRSNRYHTKREDELPGKRKPVVLEVFREEK